MYLEERQELEKELHELENSLFMLEMADKWDSEDYIIANQLRQKIKDIKEKLLDENI